MGHTANLARGHESHTAREENLEHSGVHIPPGEGARSLWVMGVLVTRKIPSHRTGGAYTLFEVATQPGSGPPPHVHHREDESFYVLEGEFEFLIGGETLRVGAGSLLYFPKGTLHAHRVLGEAVGRMLVTQTPGGLYERFFDEVGKLVEDEGRMFVVEDKPEIRRIAAERGIEIPLPITKRSRV
jgi:mannose-6-phosphate isomerase-like protein (cupin superfamily)